MLDTGEARYKVTLYFAELADIKVGDRVFSVLLQGKPVLENFDILAASGGRYRPLVQTLDNVMVEQTLRISLKPVKGRPLLSGFAVERR
jgi:hypothetical protein